MANSDMGRGPEMGSNPEEESKLPDADFIKKQTVVIGGESLIVGLTPEQAKALLKFAEKNEIMGDKERDNEMKIAKTPLSEHEKKALKDQNFIMPENGETIYLGHTTDAHEALFKAMGIEIKGEEKE